ncbi:hypothetical protein [Plantibacter sp. CFBP 8804]|uniref:hypothetical protein n=1 Tax=Plantibacter sp. CFBP 8804 TaxID=2775270 RepID=UPI00177AFA54|nr:hypothetical protein [Plantibacter sp. CFBP 8804]MBD8519041.1 hypothetical protein [Plantibacter sp. CFBP 8804]
MFVSVMDNNHAWSTVTYQLPKNGEQIQIPVFVIDIFNAPVLLSGSDSVNLLMPELLTTGFALMGSPDLAEIIDSAPNVHERSAWWDLTAADKGILRVSVNGAIFEWARAKIGSTDKAVDVPFRKAAGQYGRILVIAGVGLQINPNTGAYDLKQAARDGMLTAGYVTVRS